MYSVTAGSWVWFIIWPGQRKGLLSERSRGNTEADHISFISDNSNSQKPKLTTRAKYPWNKQKTCVQFVVRDLINCVSFMRTYDVSLMTCLVLSRKLLWLLPCSYGVTTEDVWFDSFSSFKQKMPFLKLCTLGKCINHNTMEPLPTKLSPIQKESLNNCSFALLLLNYCC